MTSARRRFWHALAAVLLGNAAYLALEPWLPPRARHVPYQLDWGLLVDFWLCLVFWGLLALLPVFRAR